MNKRLVAVLAAKGANPIKGSRAGGVRSDRGAAQTNISLAQLNCYTPGLVGVRDGKYEYVGNIGIVCTLQVSRPIFHWHRSIVTPQGCWVCQA
ncbi:hypothetical protein BaRGS_00012893, partial [Batillaria attramentaria]